MSLVPLPTDYRQLTRTIKRLQDEVDRLKGRGLESASLTRGQLTIRDKGQITIRDGGTITVSDGGNLVVDAAASSGVEETRRDETFSAGQEGVPVGTDWTDVASVTLTCPQWAANATVCATGTLVLPTKGSGITDVYARITIATQASAETLAAWSYTGSMVTWTGSAIVPLSDTENPVISLQVRASDVSNLNGPKGRAVLTGMVTWVRGA